MGSYTSRRRLYKPDVGEVGWGTLVNTNMDILDAVGEVFHFRRTGTTSDRWYCAGQITAKALTTGAPAANTLIAMPLICPRNITLDRIAINVTTQLAGSARLGIYNDSGNVYPSSLLLDAGAVDTSTTGVKSITISTTISAGRLFWLVYVANAAPTIRTLSEDACMPILGVSAALETTPGVGWTVAYTYGALSAVFPSGATPLTTAPIPAIFVRASA